MEKWRLKYMLKILLTRFNFDMSSQKDSEVQELEEQLILRLPIEEARQLRQILQHKPEKLKKLLKIDLDPSRSKACVQFCNRIFFGTVKKLPTIIESYKTHTCNNKSVIFKTADISYITECFYDDIKDNKIETSHGYCPPLKNVKKKRFRKTMYNKDFAIEAERISKELYYLLSTDLEAVSTKFEILNDNKDPAHSSIEDLFGNFTSSSNESESSD